MEPQNIVTKFIKNRCVDRVYQNVSMNFYSVITVIAFTGAAALSSHQFNNAEEMTTTLEHYAKLYNQHIVQRNLGHSTPVQTLKEWYRKKPELFKTRVYNQPGLDANE